MESASKTRKQQDSAASFLYRIEHQRLDSECLHSIDLRPYVSELCKRFSYRGRSLWLDSEGHQLFKKGLNDNAGVFTVKTYEFILRRFTEKRVNQEQAANQGGCNEDRCESQVDSSTIVTSSIFESDPVANNPAIDLSYFERRMYSRIKKSMYIGLIWNGRVYAAETRDISLSGMQLRLRMPIDVSVNEIVKVDMRPSTSRHLDSPKIDYRVVRIRHLLSDTLLALQCIEKETKDGLMVISDYIAASTQMGLTEQTDSEDALLTAQALLAERFYMRSTSLLPFFLFQNQDSGSPLRILFGNQVNLHSLAVFRDHQGQYDFTTLVTPKRIKLLIRLALRNNKADTLIAVYHSVEQSSPQVIADLECKNHKHWCRLLARNIDQPEFRVFKVVARMANRPVDVRLEDALEPLHTTDDKFAHKLLQDSKSLSIVGALIDVTEQIRDWLPKHSFNHSPCYEELAPQGSDEPHLAPPHLVPINYIQGNRSEQRFLEQIQVKVGIDGRFYPGKTHDISPHGLSVEIKNPNISFSSEDSVTITFPTFEMQGSSLARFRGTFRNVPVELVGRSDNGVRLLHFKISAVIKGRLFSSAFSDFLLKHQSELRHKTSPAPRTSVSRLYSPIFIESASTLPIFIYRKSSNNRALRLGITSSPAPLVSYFEVADGRFDFSALSSSDRLQRIVQEVDETGSSKVNLYLIKERSDDGPSFNIRSLSDFEISNETVRCEFINNAIDHDFRCFKVIVNRPNVPPRAEVEQAIDRLALLSHSKCERLKLDFDNLIAIGDVVDITGLAADLWLNIKSNA